MNERERIYGHCRACHLNCPAYYTVHDGRVVDIEAVPFSENGTQILCERARASIEFEYSPTRILHPLKRVGKRGEGTWEKISWDQACEEIAVKIHELSEKYGPETIVLPGRTGRQDMGWITARMSRVIGTPNNYYGVCQLCLLPQFHDEVQFGQMFAEPSGTMPGTKLLVALGFEFGSYADPVVGQFQTMAMANGLKVIALDPVCGAGASKCNLWLPVRPGTDLAYFLTVINYLIENDTFATGDIKEWTNLPFLVNPLTGALLRESDIEAGGSTSRYMFWDTTHNEISWWDPEEIQWKNGASGKEHFNECVARWKKNKGSAEPTPARLPDATDPALYGSYQITFKDGTTHACQPAFQLLADNVSQWTVETCERITGIPEHLIKDSCAMIKESIQAGEPIEFLQGAQYMSTNVSQLLMSINILKVMAGGLDVVGGALFVQYYPVEPMPFPGEWDISYLDGLDPDIKKKRLGYSKHPISTGRFHDEHWVNWHPQRPENADAVNVVPDISSVLEAAETGNPYEVHGIFAISSNWLLHDPATQRWMRLLDDEDKIQLHIVSDIVMTPTAEMADYVLPAATWMERNYMEWNAVGADPYKNFYRKAIEPRGEAKQDYYYCAKIAHELEKIDPKYNHGLLNPKTSHFFGGEVGRFFETNTIDEERDRLTQRFFGKTLEDCLDARRVYADDYLAGAPQRRFEISGKLNTDTGKCNLFSTVHQEYGFPPLPTYTEPEESPLSQPELAKEYPLVCSTGKRQPGFFHSEFRQLPLVRQQAPWPDVLMNRETAAQYGLSHGDWVWVQAPPTHKRGDDARVMGRVSTRFVMRPDQVTYSQHAWWRPEKTVEQGLHGTFEWNAEMLCACDGNGAPETGTLGLRSFLCKVYKCSDEDIQTYQPIITREQLEAFKAHAEMEA